MLVGERRTGAVRRVAADGDLSEPIARVVLSSGWNNPFALVVTRSGDIWVADNAPGDDPETISRGDRASGRTDLPGKGAPSALVEIDPDHLALCGYLDGELHIVELGDHPRPQEDAAATGCRTGATVLTDGRLAISDGEHVRILAIPAQGER